MDIKGQVLESNGCGVRDHMHITLQFIETRFNQNTEGSRPLLGFRELGKGGGGLSRSRGHGPDKVGVLDPSAHVVTVDTGGKEEGGRSENAFDLNRTRTNTHLF